MTSLTYMYGDATDPPRTVSASYQVIAHVTNNRGGWGKGFVLALERRFPGIGARWKRLDQSLGEYFIDSMESGANVAHLCAQDGYASPARPCALDYDALEMCLIGLATELKLEAHRRQWPFTVHMPRIGAGLAGGDWQLIECIIKDTLVADGINVYVYDLEKKK